MMNPKIRKNKCNKEPVIILTDLHGKADWITSYHNTLSSNFDVKIFNSNELANIDTREKSSEDIHKEFLDGGIELAVKSLINQLNAAYIVVGFSIGGLIAWRACMEELKTTHLIAICSTRLRLEVQKPDCELHLFYGENDGHQPPPLWFTQLGLLNNIIPNKGHDLYKDDEWTNYFIQYINDLS